MDYRFEFDADEVLALIEESRTAKERLMTEAQRYVAAGVDLHAGSPDLDEEIDHPGTGSPPGLWLMNDRGVYLQSNASRRKGNRVAYARGYQTDVQVGDEAMCEFVDAAKLEQLRPGDVLVITLTEEKMRLSLLREG